MHKIVISGYYGFNNIGDESILKAVVENLRDRLENIEITVLSQNPELTSEKYKVKAIPRMSLTAIFKAISRADILISGGGSLLQDVTSKRSIVYYLVIMWIALFLRKKVFIYSQGIGPVNFKLNRKLVLWTLKRINYIVVRDEASKDFLTEIGIAENQIYVTADPVIRIKRAELEQGRKILWNSRFSFDKTGPAVGIAIRGRKADEEFTNEMCLAINELTSRYGARVVLIPFHFSEDMPVATEILKRMGDKVICLNHKYLTEEMLSIIGNMDVLVGIRLHSLIHAAIMDVPMIAISYDPKVNSFMRSIGLKAMCSVYDFTSEFFIEEFDNVMKNRDKIVQKVRENKEGLILKLNQNEDLIKELLEEGEKKHQ